ncbi:MAG: Bor family protein [Tannerellaceae bacterium]|nr:Bor family protein [Tannerellaceae bacterium]
MKKVFCVLCCVALLSSCYTAKLVVGEEAAAYTKVASVKNHFLVGGLIPLKNQYGTKEIAGNAKNYVVQTQHSFVDLLVGALTSGIYTPTTTTILVPAN